MMHIKMEFGNLKMISQSRKVESKNDFRNVKSKVRIEFFVCL